MRVVSILDRRGVSLPEVLVAAVLLAIGVAGCLSAMSTALRFRTMALTRESIAALAQARLAWFDVHGCTVPDTTIASQPTAPVHERWSVHRDSTIARFEGDASATHAGRPMRLALRSAKRCG